MPSPLKTPFMNAQDYFKRQGLTEVEIRQMGISVLGASACSETLGYKVHYDGVFIPYPDKNYFRIRMLGGVKKYLCKRGTGHGPVYFPASKKWPDIRADVTQNIWITEGEFKSWKACLHGVNCLGLGGVDMQEALFQEDIEWQDRRVFIVFDKDVGYESGTYKPEVDRALGRLTTRLIGRGAQVWICHIPGALDEKFGLDDYLLSGGTLDFLASTAKVPPPHCEMLSELLEKCIYVVGTDHTHVYNLDDGSRKGVGDFHDAHVNKTRVVPVPDAAPKIEKLSRVWLLHKLRQTAKTYTLDPSCGRGLVGDKINLWVPYPSFPEVTEGVEEEWQKFMEGLFGEHWRWVGAWVGHMLNRPEEKAHQAVMLVTSVRGVGKSLFSEIVGKLVGDHGLECKPEEVLDKFNKGMEGATWVAIHELELSSGLSEGQVNNLITSERYKVEGKGRDAMFLPDLRRWYMTTNASVPMRMSKGQRRILIIFPPRIHADTRGEWGRWVGSELAGYKRNPGALGAIRLWFDTCLEDWEKEFGAWNPTAPVPLTEAGEEAAEASMTVNQILRDAAISWMEEHGGMGLLMPEHRQLLAKVSASIGQEVRSRGGAVLRHRIDGKEVVVWDLSAQLPSRFKETNRTTWLHSTLYEGTNDSLKSAAGGLWTAISGLRERLSGGSDKF